MASAFALFTSDPNLLDCELHRLQGQVVLSEASDRTASAGLGSYAQDEVLLRRFAPSSLPRDVTDLAPRQGSEALLFHAQTLPLGASLEEYAQPFRFRRWLFCQLGEVQNYRQVRPQLYAELPEFLRRPLSDDGEAHGSFALFLKSLREVGDWQGDELRLSAHAGAAALGKTLRRLRELSSDAGSTRASSLALIATNAQMLLVAREGDEPIHYMLLEGSEQCEVCGLTAQRSPPNLLRAHRQRRTVAVASRVSRSFHGLELPSGQALAVDWRVGVETVPF